MAAIYLFGMKPKLKDDAWGTDTRCQCMAQANIRITIRNGEPSAACPVCHMEYVVMVEGPGRGDMWPVPPNQIIGGANNG